MKNFQEQENKANETIFGTRAILEAIKAGREIDKVLVQKGLKNDLILELHQVCHEMQIPILKVPIEKLNNITRKNHQGAICYLSAITYASLDHVIEQCYMEGRDPLLLILDRVTDVRNFGAIARTAECAGVDAIVIPGKNSAQVNADAVKTSAGALHYIPVCRVKNLMESVDYLKKNGIQIIACTEKTDHTIYKGNYTKPTAIIMGSEENGIANDLIKRADMCVKIPMTGNIDSLNVSVASAIMTYEVIRQRTEHQG